LGFRRLGASSATLGLLLLTKVAWAQSPIERETARQLMHDGYALQTKGDNTGALEAFRRAHTIMNVPTTGIEVGRALVALGKIVEARDVLWRVARMKDAPDDPPVYRSAKEDARKLTESLAQKLASLRIVPRSPDYKIAIDGTELSPALIGVATKVDPGEHVIVAQRDGRKAEVRVTVAESETKEVPIAIDPGSPTLPLPTPSQAKKDPAGESPRSNEANESNEANKAGDAAASHRDVSPLIWAGFIGAGASLVVGGVTGVLAIARKSDATSNCQGNQCLPAAQDSIDSSRTFADISTGAFIAGGALSLISGIFFFVEKSGSSSSPRAAWVRPFVLKDHAGIVGSF